MKIKALTGYSFNGIKVNGRKKKDENGVYDPNMPRVRQAQYQVMQNWTKELNELQKQMDGVEIKDPDKVSRGEYLPEAIKAMDTSDITSASAKRRHDAVLDGYRDILGSLQKQAGYVEKMYALAVESLAEIERLDNEDKNRPLEDFNQWDNFTQQRSTTSGVKDVGGYQYEMSVLREEFIDKVNAEQEGQAPNIVGSVLFFGPFGNGKTYITKTVAKETGCPVYSVRTSNNAKDSAVAAMEKVKLYAKKAQENFENTGKRSIIFIDEIDRIIDENSPIKNEFEQFIKTCSKKHHCTVFAATNTPSALALNMNDNDVFPIKMSIDPPDKENMEQVLEFLFAKYPQKNINYSELAQELMEFETQTGAKFSNGQISDICRGVCKQADGETIEQGDIIKYIKDNNITPAITEEIDKIFQDEYNKFIGNEE